ncbi:hypothetical protein E4U51_002033 [Claviceps purpurea]|nr:hypothetical protein E4U51_002033 [Claviceps purpurea]
MERKRVSTDNAYQSKRARCQSTKQLSETYNSIDSIPSRSSTNFPIDYGFVPVALRTRPTAISSGPNVSFSSSTSTATSTPTKDSVFSTSTNWSFTSSKNTSFSIDNASTSEESCSEYHSSKEWPTDSDFELEPRPSSLYWEKKLSAVFPKFENGSFNNVPLPVVWEITRCALHCGVKLEEIDLSQGNPNDWVNQTNLRDFLSQQKAFQGKHLPEPTKSTDWIAALDPRQCQHGAIRYSGELVPQHVKDAEGPLLTLKLNPLRRTRSSHRLGRRFGFDRFLEISMPSIEDIEEATHCTDDSIKDWWVRGKHYFLGRLWSAFYCKKDDVKTQKRRGKGEMPSRTWYTFIFFACNGDSFRNRPDGSIPPHEDAVILDRRVRVTLGQMIGWAIGDLRKTEQQVAKLFSRIALSLTDTTPTIVLEKHQIYHCPDDIGKFPMNDGIGRMSKSLAIKIASCLGLGDVPCAFQARFGSAKGMWLVDNEYTPPNMDDDDDDWIVTYPSQRKWDCSYQDVHHCTFEALSWPKEAKPASLNQQFIALLEAQAIDPMRMRELIAQYLRDCLREGLDDLKNAMEHPLDLRYWLQRTGGGSRADTAGALEDQQPILGGLPQRIEDKVASLVDAGFVPSQCQFLQELCEKLGTQMAEMLKKKMNILVPCSAYLFMVVDFSSILKEDEVHVSFSTKFQVPGFSDTLLENMDVLVGRVPAHLPHDIQRVRVVSHPRLRHLKDVIVFPIKGNRPLADKLSGGDYDGDKAWVCWDQAIVQNFRNAPDSAHDVQAPQVAKFHLPMSQVRKEAQSEAEVCDRLLYEGITFAMQSSLLGLCTKYKDEYCRKTGSLSSPQVIMMSLLLGLLVDQSKQGYIFTLDDWQALLKQWSLPRSLKDGPTGTFNPRSKPSLHILDYLQDVANATVHDTLSQLKSHFKSQPAQWYDEHLTSKFNTYDHEHKSVPEWILLRDKLRDDINALITQWVSQPNSDDATETFEDTIKAFYEQWQNIQPLEKVQSSKFIQTLLRDGTKNPHASTWELLKASYAMVRLQNATSKLVWWMAGWQLCRLKQDMAGVRYAGVRPEVYSAMQVDKKVVVRRRARRVSDEDGVLEEEEEDEEEEDDDL